MNRVPPKCSSAFRLPFFCPSSLCTQLKCDSPSRLTPTHVLLGIECAHLATFRTAGGAGPGPAHPVADLLHSDARSKWHMKPFKDCTTMNVFSEPLDRAFGGLSDDAYLDAICDLYRVQACSVPSYGACFFDSIYALLPTVGKAVKSSRALRLSCVDFMRQCCQGQHGMLGERIVEDVTDALKRRIVSSCSTRQHNKVPKTLEKYFEAVSLSSTWVEGAT